MRIRLPFATVTCAVFVIVASFLPWACFEYDMPFGINGTDGDHSAPVVATAWNSNLTALGFITPNWIVVAFAVLIAALMLLAAYHAWPTAQKLAYGLCWYGMIYTGICVFQIASVFIKDVQYSVSLLGVGSLVTLACFIVMAVQAGLFEPAPVNRETPVRSE